MLCCQRTTNPKARGSTPLGRTIEGRGTEHRPPARDPGCEGGDGGRRGCAAHGPGPRGSPPRWGARRGAGRRRGGAGGPRHRPRTEPDGRRPRSHRPRRGGGDSSGGGGGGKLPAHGCRALYDDRAVRDVLRRGASRAHRAPRVRRGRSEDRRRAHTVPAAGGFAAEPSGGRGGGRPRRGMRRALGRVLSQEKILKLPRRGGRARLKASDSKSDRGVSPSGVQILSPPPTILPVGAPSQGSGARRSGKRSARAVLTRRGDRAAEGAALEMPCTGNPCAAGSNPAPSANFVFDVAVLDGEVAVPCCPQSA